MDKVLFLAGSISKLIIKCALILPNKKISEVSVEFVIKKMDEKDEAEVIDINTIKYLEELGLTLDEFIEISLRAIQGIS